jgi:hypothetical protein
MPVPEGEIIHFIKDAVSIIEENFAKIDADKKEYLAAEPHQDEDALEQEALQRKNDFCQYLFDKMNEYMDYEKWKAQVEAGEISPDSPNPIRKMFEKNWPAIAGHVPQTYKEYRDG